MAHLTAKTALDTAFSYASYMSGCNKVAVGSAIVKNDVIIGLGANKAMPNRCRTVDGCLRIQKYGNDSKTHRDPADCRAIHSEVDAICMAAKVGVNTDGADIYVTRYPCESCAKAIVAAGIKNVYYGGTAQISKQTQEIFEAYDINCFFIDGWKEDNTDK